MELPSKVWKASYDSKEGRLHMVLDRDETQFKAVKCPPWLVSVFDDERHEGRLEVRNEIRSALDIH